MMFGKRSNRSQSVDNNEFPEDEFDHNAQLDMAEATDEWAGDDDDQAAAPVRKASSGFGKMIPFVALGLVAAAGAGYFYLNYMAPKQGGQQASPIIAAAPEPAAPADLGAEPDFETAAAPEVVVAEPSAVLDAEPSEPAAAPVELTAADPLSEALPADDTLVSVADEPVAIEAAPVEVAPVEVPVEEVPVVVTQPVVTAPAPVAALETLGSQPAPVAAPAPVTAPAVVAPVEAAATGDTAMRLSVVEHQMADVAKAVDTLVAKQGSGDLTAQVAALEAQVKALQAELRAAKLAAPAVVTAPRQAAPVVDEPAAVTKPKAAVTKPAPAATTATAVRSAWVLRAAQAGEAWVSRGAQGNLQSVKIGDSLPGVGRITAITQRDGVWVVVGTSGSLRQ